MTESPSLATKYPELDSLSIKFSYVNPDGSSRNHEIKYSVNLERAASVLRVDCVNQNCVGGDYDLSELLNDAVSARETKFGGQLRCEGWSDRRTIDQQRCHQLLTFEVTLEYR